MERDFELRIRTYADVLPICSSFIMAAAVVAPPAALAEVPVPDLDKQEVDIKVEEKIEEKIEETPLPFDPVKLKEKYLAERDKRLAKGQGVEQYIVLDGHLSHYLQDPWVEHGFTRDPIEEEVDVVIIGGGYGAQVVAVRLLEAGVTNFRIVEKAGDFGGTWYDYPFPTVPAGTPLTQLQGIGTATPAHNAISNPTSTCPFSRKSVICPQRNTPVPKSSFAIRG